MQCSTHQAFCQCRRIAFSTQVGQNDIFQGIVRHAPQQVARLLVGKMTVPGRYALLQRPRSFGRGRQHFRIVIGLHHQAVHHGQVFRHASGGLPRVADKAQAGLFRLKLEAHRVHGVMVSGKRRDDNIPYLERLPFLKISPGSFRSLFLDAQGGMARGVHAHGVLSGKLVHALHVVGVFVSKQNGIKIIRLHSGISHSFPESCGAESGIHQQHGIPRFHNGGLSSAAAAQHAKLHHGRKYNLPPRAGQDRINAFFSGIHARKE